MRNRETRSPEHGFPACPEYVVTGDDGCPETIDMFQPADALKPKFQRSAQSWHERRRVRVPSLALATSASPSRNRMSLTLIKGYHPDDTSIPAIGSSSVEKALTS
jgi:hypothetical protein